MMMPILIALAAGCASALMFASIISGALVSLLLFYLAPLPLLVAALGWGTTGAVVGGLVAGISLGALFGIPYFITFAVTVVLPACLLGHVALLARQLPAPAASGNDSAPQPTTVTEWYPVGRLVAWIAGFAALTTMAALFTLGTDAATITSALRGGLQRMLGARDATDAADIADIAKLAGAMAVVAPAAAAIVATMMLTLNLFLAAKIARISGRLHRPWPDLKATELPPMTLAVLSAAIALCFLDGLPAMFGQTSTAALTIAYALAGFAALHTLTLPIRHRTFVLSSTYALVMVFGWPVLAMVALGIADAVLGLRHRNVLRPPPPPSPV
ncbi:MULTISPECIES: hypothetical protein [Rhodopseudomonas]|uniref:Membrane protein n=1 Tax=Rhodopseudomonas palustris TaxID=1076 RepID=A0A0D7EQU1_RHOPL|nr:MULTISPECIES: hypothetical protein [Rhodopseudomonas]KIZ41812.1 membrane protein [Rhodopseudomonas palustris]MDF3810109.1 hypothetical protein [Rhodopseudomonas sp. BAL398]WOK20627.1 hypothetical protein RBJ75_07165 [Rhodopseudomonas sp. BAL398]